jgi:hypothetical protein
VNKSQAVRDVLAELPPGTPAADIADIVGSRYDLDVSAAYVRTVKSRESGSTDTSPRPSRPGPPRVRPGDRQSAAIVRASALPSPVIDPPPDDDDEYEPDTVTAVPVPRFEVTRHRPAPARRPGAPVRVPDLAESEIAALIDGTLTAIESALSGPPRKIKGDRALIRNIAAILDDPQVRASYPGYRYEITPGTGQWLSLTVSGPDYEPVAQLTKTDMRGAGIIQPQQDWLRRKRETRLNTCQFCERGASLGVPLYVVTGGPLNHPYLLCGLHTEYETRAGATARPYGMTLAS